MDQEERKQATIKFSIVGEKKTRKDVRRNKQ
jgi:hypothetical protein